MASRLLRRSGISVGLVAASLEWRPDEIFQIGVGVNHQEIDVLSQEWQGVVWTGCEPHPDIYNSMKDTYPGVLHRVAIAGFNGHASLLSKRNHIDGSTLYPGEEQTGRQHRVAVRTLDSMFPPPQPDKRVLLWLDCEGCELEALQGGEKFVAGVDVMNIEMTACPPNPKWGGMVDIYNWLAQRGFYLQWVHTQRIYVGQVDGVFVRRVLFVPGLCCIPQEIARFQCEESST